MCEVTLNLVYFGPDRGDMVCLFTDCRHTMLQGSLKDEETIYTVYSIQVSVIE